nr:hypothetical protein Iba_scaffold49027CG0010 [Ipomoea batatas]
MLLFCHAIALFYNSSCNNPCTAWRSTSAPGSNIEPFIYILFKQNNISSACITCIIQYKTRYRILLLSTTIDNTEMLLDTLNKRSFDARQSQSMLP